MKKKMLCVLTVSMMTLSLMACGQKELDSSENNTRTIEETENENEMSQSEWIDEHAGEYEDGYEVVDSINIDTPEILLKYTGYEIIDGEDNDGNQIKEAILYFDYSNKTSIPERIYEAISIEVFQNGIQLINWISDIEGNQSVENSYNTIIDGTTLNVGMIFELEDTENPLLIRVCQSYSDMYGDNAELFYQQQELEIQ